MSGRINRNGGVSGGFHPPPVTLAILGRRALVFALHQSGDPNFDLQYCA
jgi:hypothetical protein